MASTRALRILLSAVACGLVAVTAATPALAVAQQTPRPPLTDGISHAKPASLKTPPPPQLPANFQGKGRYIVRDLGIDVPFTWQGRNGDSQMVAGGKNYPIWFTNLIYHNTLYTLTYKWPNVQPPHSCSKIPGTFNRQLLNEKLKTSRFVGPEILQGRTDRYVDHWRVGVVGGSTEPGEDFRFPIALGDVYVDQKNPSKWWQVLQFGFQNLFDPELDEWFRMTTFSQRPGEVTLPARCAPPTP